MLTVGTDTFVSVADANVYISEYYLTTDDKYTAWNTLSESGKEIYLRQACRELCLLKYIGVTYEAFQPLPFPRFVGDDYVMAYRQLIAPEAVLYPEMQEIPKAVIFAQIEEALETIAPSEDTDAFIARNGAVDSYTIGHLSEHFKGSVTDAEAVLKSVRAQELMKPYLGGSYDID